MMIILIIKLIKAKQMQREIKVLVSEDGYKATVTYNGSLYHTIKGELEDVQAQVMEDISELIMEAYESNDRVAIEFLHDDERLA